MEIESAHTHDVYGGHSTRGIQAIGERSARKIDMAAYRNTPQEQERISDLINIIPKRPKGPKGKDSVLDIGARDGYLTRLLTEYFASVTALDLEKPSIAHERINCVEGDVTRLELAGCYRGSADEMAELGLPDAIVTTRLPPHPFDLYCWLRSTFKRKARGAGTAVEVDTPLSEKGMLRRLLLSALSIPDISPVPYEKDQDHALTAPQGRNA